MRDGEADEGVIETGDASVALPDEGMTAVAAKDISIGYQRS